MNHKTIASWLILGIIFIIILVIVSPTFKTNVDMKVTRLDTKYDDEYIVLNSEVPDFWKVWKIGTKEDPKENAEWVIWIDTTTNIKYIQVGYWRNTAISRYWETDEAQVPGRN